MKYQIKEALDKISYLGHCDPSKVTLAKVEPNNIHLTYVNEGDVATEYIYTNGNLFLLLDGNPVKLPLHVDMITQPPLPPYRIRH